MFRDKGAKVILAREKNYIKKYYYKIKTINPSPKKDNITQNYPIKANKSPKKQWV